METNFNVLIRCFNDNTILNYFILKRNKVSEDMLCRMFMFSNLIKDGLYKEPDIMDLVEYTEMIRFIQTNSINFNNDTIYDTDIDFTFVYYY